MKKLLAMVLLGSIAQAQDLAPGEVALPGCLFHHHQELAKQQLVSNRPASDFSFASSIFPLTVHWPANVDEAYAKEILGYAEESWRTEFETMKFMKPHGDGDLGGDSNLDLYITTDLDPGIGGYAGFSGFVEETPRQDAYGYLVINNNIDMRIRRFVVAHEIFHLSHMAYDWWEDLSFMEASATWIGDHVFGDENIYWRFFPYFNQEPYTALDYISIRNPFQYGAGLFTTFLDEKYGQGDGAFIREIWERSTQNDIDNEPDFLDSINTLLPAGVSMEQAYEQFGVWRLLTGSRKQHGFFKERLLWDERMDPWLELNSKIEDLPQAGTAQKAVGPYAHAYLRLTSESASTKKISAKITGKDTKFSVQHLAITANGLRLTPIGSLFNQASLEFTFEVQAYDVEHIIIVTNVTDGRYDSDTSPWTGSEFSYSFRSE